MISEKVKEQLSEALGDLHLLGFQEGYNDKAIEIIKVHKEGNNALLRVEATNRYLEALALKKTYAEKQDYVIQRIMDLILERPVEDTDVDNDK